MNNLNQLFQNFLLKNFYNKFFNAVANYINNNIDDIIFRNCSFDPDTAELSEIEGKRIIVNDKPGTILSFDFIVEAEITVAQVLRGHYHKDSEDCTEWFRINCTGDLEQFLRDLEIGDICVYKNDENNSDTLSNNLTPFLSCNKLDEIATDLLNNYYPEALEKIIKIDADSFIERMGLKYEERCMSLDHSTFGAIFFNSCNTQFYDTKTGEPYNCSISERTIVVDSDSNCETLNYTKIHECAHWKLHRKRFLFEKLLNKEAHQIKCSVSNNAHVPKEKTDTEWLEWQANSLAAHILMPKKQFQRKALDLINSYISELAPEYEAEILELVVDNLAKFFEVSRTAILIRMVDVGFNEALGVYNWVDNHYVSVHGFLKNPVARNQTFSISFDDFGFALMTNPDLKDCLKKQSFIYIDSHICLNKPRYIEKNGKGFLCMTKYARFHMDECCLLFDVSIKNAEMNQNRIYDCALCRGISSRIYFETNISRDKNGEKINEALAMREYDKEIKEKLLNMPRDFVKSLDYLLEWNEMSQVELAEKSGLSARTITKIKEPNHQQTIKTVVALCIGMRLPYILCVELIKVAGLSFNFSNDNHVAYSTLLLGYGSMTIWECNDLLIQRGVEPLINLNLKKDKDLLL